MTEHNTIKGVKGSVLFQLSVKSFNLCERDGKTVPF